MPKILRIKKLPLGKDFLALTLGEFILAREPLTPSAVNHELIHVAQQRELLYIPFFIWYGIEWLVLCIKYRDRIKAYYNIRFEKEAYNHQQDLQYLKNRKRFRYS